MLKSWVLQQHILKVKSTNYRKILYCFRNDSISHIVFLGINITCQEEFSDEKFLSPAFQTEVSQGCFSKHVFSTTNSPPLWCILPLPALSPVEFHFRIKIGICFLGRGVVGKNLHICGWLFHHFVRRLGSRNWNKSLRWKERIGENCN